MKAADANILLVPGMSGAGPVHWMTRWEKGMKSARRVDMPNLDAPVLPQWVDALIGAVSKADKPVVLVAHSLGVLAAAHAASEFAPGKVAGGFLVAPPSKRWVESEYDIDNGFAGFPMDPLPFTSMLVASRTDETCDFATSEELALKWLSELVDAGDSGHLNTQSGHGPWPEGALRFASFMARLEP